MENQPWYDGVGQSYGWTLYSKSVKSGGEVQTYGQIRDRTSVYLNGSHITTFDCNTIDYKFKIVSWVCLLFDRIEVHGSGCTTALRRLHCSIYCMYCLTPPTSLCSDYTENLHRLTVELIPRQCPYPRSKVIVLATYQTLWSQPIEYEVLWINSNPVHLSWLCLCRATGLASLIQFGNSRLSVGVVSSLFDEKTIPHHLSMR